MFFVYYTICDNFFSKKYIVLKAMLNGSEISVNGDSIDVMLKSKSKFMLEQKNANKTISEFLHNTTGKTFSVNFVEPDKIEPIENKEELIIKNIIEENAKRALENANKPKEEKKVSNENPPMKMGFAASNAQYNLDQSNAPKVEQSGNNNNQEQSRRAPKKRSMEYIKDPEALIYKGWRDTKDPKEVKIINLSPEQPGVIITGKISNYDSRETKNGGFLISFDIYDGTSSINVKAFLKANEFGEVHPKMKATKAVRLVGTYEYNTFSKEFGVIADSLEETKIEEKIRMDNSEEKRVELHMHTQMSMMDGMTSATDLIKRAIKWGHKAIAITDHGVVQSFPEAKKAAKDSDLKVIYGVEAYLVPDRLTSINNFKDENLNDVTYCVLDIETTGLSKQTDKITELILLNVL